MKFNKIIPNVDLEDYKTEFKGILKEGPSITNNGENLENGWLKEFVAFANTMGGTLYVGVDNKTHEILSIDRNTLDKMVLMIHRLVKERIEPQIYYKITPINVGNNRYILKIDIDKAQNPPIILKFKGMSSIYVRHFGLCSIATAEEIRDMVINSENLPYDQIITDELYDENEFSYLREFYKKQNKKELTKKELISIGFMSKDYKLSRGALLFKNDCSNLNTLVACSQFLGFSKGDDIFYNTIDIKGNLLYELNEILKFISARGADGFIKTSEGREKLISYPKRSLIEAITNALGHRNYFINGSQIEVNLYKDRLEIISPGSLVGSRWLNRETNLSSIPPIRRNEVICSIFNICKVMDKKGSGFDKIEEEYKPYGINFAPMATSNNQFFSLTLPNLAYKGGLKNINDNPNVKAFEELPGKNDLKILSYCYNKNRTISEIAKFLNIKPTTYLRKEVIKRLVNKGYLIEYNNYNPITYLTNKKNVFIE